MQSDLLGGIFKRSVALVAEKPIVAAQTADYHVGKSVIVAVGDGESVACDIAADTVRSQSDLDRDIFEQPAHDLRLLDFCREIKRPLASALANLEQQGVFPFL